MRAPERLYGLDALRGFAAIAVVVFHWQFWGADPNRVAPPAGFHFPQVVGEDALRFFYQCGGSAVGLFFTLSGFVFYWLYRRAIQDARVDGLWFFVDRFSRLYPLYFVTLVWAWGGHNLYAWMNQGPGWSSGTNNLSGFLRQMFVFPLWTPDRVIGFNLPSWSLAVEALLYLMFFTMGKLRRLGIGGTLAMLLLALPMGLYSSDISYGMTSFFMGGLCCIAFERIDGDWLERALRILVVVSWLPALVFGAGVINLALTPLAFLDHYFAMYVMYPATVLYLAVLESRRGTIARRLSRFGDATYAIYLLHFPLMLTTAIVFRATGGDFQTLRSPLSLLVFLAAVILLAFVSHAFFERPMQRWIRRTYSGKNADGHPPASIADVAT